MVLLGRKTRAPSSVPPLGCMYSIRRIITQSVRRNEGDVPNTRVYGTVRSVSSKTTTWREDKPRGNSMRRRMTGTNTHINYGNRQYSSNYRYEIGNLE
mmetsp:Transcript_41847/g.48292  ORF Transcript_41847/g.48292 Transcript_41847/m.48292 type:complete len:98 (+) Transcript_41847:470-763(+)